MRIALVDGVRRVPTPGAKGICTGCGEELVAKCGQVNAWHWAHLPASECPYKDDHSVWKNVWKGFFPDEQVERWINGVRVDIVGKGNIYIMLCDTSPSPEEAEKMEDLFGDKLAWILNGNGILGQKGLSLRKKSGDFPNSNYRTFRWKHARRSLAFCTKGNIYIDLDNTHFFHFKKLYLDEAPYGGWGYVMMPQEFVKWKGGSFNEDMYSLATMTKKEKVGNARRGASLQGSTEQKISLYRRVHRHIQW